MKIGEIWECIKNDAGRQVFVGDRIRIAAIEDDIIFANDLEIPYVVLFWDRQYFIQIFKKVYLEDE